MFVYTDSVADTIRLTLEKLTIQKLTVIKHVANQKHIVPNETQTHDLHIGKS